MNWEGNLVRSGGKSMTSDRYYGGCSGSRKPTVSKVMSISPMPGELESERQDR